MFRCWWRSANKTWHTNKRCIFELEVCTCVCLLMLADFIYKPDPEKSRCQGKFEKFLNRRGFFVIQVSLSASWVMRNIEPFHYKQHRSLECWDWCWWMVEVSRWVWKMAKIKQWVGKMSEINRWVEEITEITTWKTISVTWHKITGESAAQTPAPVHSSGIFIYSSVYTSTQSHTENTKPSLPFTVIQNSTSTKSYLSRHQYSTSQ